MTRPPVLNRRLTLESQTRASDGAGGAITAWTPLGDHWAEIDARSGREDAGPGRFRSRVSVRITVRATEYGAPSRPRADMRFREGARIFRILAVTEADHDRRFLTCWAEEVTNR